jgi:hypothetical protein
MRRECADLTLKTVPLCTSHKPASADVPFPDCRAMTFARRATWRPSRKGLRGSGFAVRVPLYPCSRAELSLIGDQQFPVFANREFAPKPLPSHAFFDLIATWAASGSNKFPVNSLFPCLRRRRLVGPGLRAPPPSPRTTRCGMLIEVSPLDQGLAGGCCWTTAIWRTLLSAVRSQLLALSPLANSVLPCPPMCTRRQAVIAATDLDCESRPVFGTDPS